MLTEVESRGGKDWNDVLGYILLAYHTYGCDTGILTSLDFYLPTVTMPVLETDYCKELLESYKKLK